MTEPLVFEIVTLAVFLAAGFSIAKLLGVRSTLQALGLGLGLSVIWRALSHTLLYLLGLGQLSQLVWLVGSLIAIAVAGFIKLRDNSHWLGLGLSSMLALVAGSVSRGLDLRGIPHSDSMWILTLSDLMQRSGDMEIVGGRTAIKRGFAYPISLALGPNGESLTGLTPLIFIALLLAIFWAISTLAPKLDLKSWTLIALPVIAVLLSAPIVLRAVWYVNGHTLTALGVVLSVTAVVVSIRDQVVTKPMLATIMVGLSLISLTRPEGVAFAAVIAAPLLAQKFIGRWQVRAIAFSALMAFGIWMYAYDGYIPNLLRLYDERFPIAMLIGSYLVGLKILDRLRYLLVPFALAGMTLILGFVLIRNFASLSDDLIAQAKNMFLGAGFWGGVFIALIIGLALIGVKGLSAEYKTLLLISLMLVLGSLAAKLMDGGLFGDPTLGREGWTDSLNRMWLHSFGIFIIALVVGYAERIKEKAKVSA